MNLRNLALSLLLLGQQASGETPEPAAPAAPTTGEIVGPKLCEIPADSHKRIDGELGVLQAATLKAVETCHDSALGDQCLTTCLAPLKEEYDRLNRWVSNDLPEGTCEIKPEKPAAENGQKNSLQLVRASSLNITFTAHARRERALAVKKDAELCEKNVPARACASFGLAEEAKKFVEHCRKIAREGGKVAQDAERLESALRARAAQADGRAKNLGTITAPAPRATPPEAAARKPESEGSFPRIPTIPSIPSFGGGKDGNAGSSSTAGSAGAGATSPTGDTLSLPLKHGTATLAETEGKEADKPGRSLASSDLPNAKPEIIAPEPTRAFETTTSHGGSSLSGASAIATNASTEPRPAAKPAQGRVSAGASPETSTESALPESPTRSVRARPLEGGFDVGAPNTGGGMVRFDGVSFEAAKSGATNPGLMEVAARELRDDLGIPEAHAAPAIAAAEPLDGSLFQRVSARYQNAMRKGDLMPRHRKLE